MMVKQVIQKAQHDVDENALHEELMARHPGVPFIVESDTEGTWVAVTRPEEIDIDPDIARVRGKRRMSKRERDRATYASLGTVQAKVDFIARRMGLID